jgi:hypothetical protein
MHPHLILNLIAVILTLFVFLTAISGEDIKIIHDSLPTGSSFGPIPKDPTTLAQNKAGTDLDAASAQWSDIKDVTYDARPQFFAGLKRLESKVNAQCNELTTKRASMKSTTDTNAWDFAMKEMSDARSFLKSVGEELGKASSETWNQQKETVGQAWERTQVAYAKVKSTTTN